MKWFLDLKIRFKLLTSFVLVALIAGAVGLVGINNIRKIVDADKKLYEKDTVGISLLGEVGVKFQRIRVNTHKLVILSSAADRSTAAAKITAFSKDISTALDKYEKTINAPGEREAYEKFQETRKPYINELRRIITASNAGRTDEMTHILNTSAAQSALAEQDAINNLVAIKVKSGKVMSNSNEALAGKSVQMMCFLILIALVLAIGAGMFVAKVIGDPTRMLVEAADKLAVGDVDVTINATSKDELGELAGSMSRMVASIHDQAAVADRIAAGDPTVNVKPRSDADILGKSLASVIGTLHSLVDEANMLSNAAIEGRLDTRGDVSKFTGGYREIVQGVNQTLDSLVGNFEAIPTPIQFMDKDFHIQYINETGAKMLGQSKKQLAGRKCSDVWNTSKCRTKDCPCQLAMDSNSIHTCENDTCIGNKQLDIFCAGAPLRDGNNNVIGSFEFVTDQSEIKQAARMTQKVSDFQAVEVHKLVESLDKLAAGDLNFALSVENGDADTAEVKQKFEAIADAVNACGSAIKGLVHDAKELAEGAIDCRFDIHADASKHLGAYADVVQEVDNAIQALAVPFKHVGEHVANLGKGIVPEAITREYKNDIERVKNGLNDCFSAIRALISDTEALSQAALNGNLSVRADVTRHRGEYAKVVNGINETLDAVINPVNEAAAVLEKLAQNDLTARMVGDYKGDHAKIKESLNNAMDTLDKAIAHVTESANKVTASSQSLSVTAEELGKGAQQIAETIQQVAAGSQSQSTTVQSSAAGMEQLSRAISEVSAGAQSQARSVDETVALVQQISAAIEQVAKLSEEAAETGQQVSDVATNGGKQVADAVGSMDRIKDATDKVAEMIGRLGESSQQIGAIVETIDDIAEQTNLLALNAAIEAARAGEHGKGFAVVADEVRKLAERSSKATGEIAELINEVRQMTDQAVEAMEKSSREVAEGTVLGNQAGEALHAIQDAVAGVTRQVQEMSAAAQNMSGSSTEVIKAIESVSAITEESSAATEEMAASSNEVVQQIEQVAAVSQENAAASEEVSATVEEQNASVEEMSASAEELSHMARGLQELVNQFKIDSGKGDSVQYIRGGDTRRKAA